MKFKDLLKVMEDGYILVYINDELETSADTKYMKMKIKNKLTSCGELKVKYIGIESQFKDNFIHWVVKL